MFALNTQGALCHPSHSTAHLKLGSGTRRLMAELEIAYTNRTIILDLAGELAHYKESGFGSAFTKPPPHHQGGEILRYDLG